MQVLTGYLSDENTVTPLDFFFFFWTLGAETELKGGEAKKTMN